MSIANSPAPTAPLSPAAADALARLESALAPQLTAARYVQVSARCSELSAESSDYEAMLDAQDELAMCRRQLAEAGRLDLIEVS